MTRVLFVCMGNICRSPTAEAVVRELARRERPGLALEVDSAGTHGYHTGSPPDERSIAAARRRGYDLGALRARVVEAGDFEPFDLVLAMDEEVYDRLQQMRRARRRRGSRCSWNSRPRSAGATCPIRTTAGRRLRGSAGPGGGGRARPAGGAGRARLIHSFGPKCWPSPGDDDQTV